MIGTTLRTSLKIALTFAGTVIGAGFASGQELLQFFITYGSLGFYGIFFAGFLFAWLGYRLLTVSNQLQLTSYPQLIYHLCGPKAGIFFDYAISFFLFTVLVIMLAAAGTIAQSMFALPFYQGQHLLAVAITLAALNGVSGIMKINIFSTPLLAFIIVMVSLSSLNYHNYSLENFNAAAYYSAQPAPHWLLACLLYVSYNLILGITVLVPLGKSASNTAARKVGSMLGGLLLAFLSFLIVSTIIIHCPDILLIQIPMLTISCSQHYLHGLLYALIFIIALFTTSLGCLYGCACKLKTILPLPYPLCLVLTVGTAIFFTQIGFSNLIGIVFPIFGYTTLWILVRLMFTKI